MKKNQRMIRETSLNLYLSCHRSNISKLISSRGRRLSGHNMCLRRYQTSANNPEKDSYSKQNAHREDNSPNHDYRVTTTMAKVVS